MLQEFVLFHSLSKYLLSTYYVPGTALGAEVIAVNKINIPAFRELTFCGAVGERRQILKIDDRWINK